MKKNLLIKFLPLKERKKKGKCLKSYDLDKLDGYRPFGSSNLKIRRQEIAEIVKSKTGRKMQSRAVPIRCGILEIPFDWNEDRILDLINKFINKLFDDYRIVPIKIEIYSEKDKAYYVHFIVDWYDHNTGKGLLISREDLANIQKIAADLLGVKRTVRRQFENKAQPKADPKIEEQPVIKEQPKPILNPIEEKERERREEQKEIIQSLSVEELMKNADEIISMAKQGDINQSLSAEELKKRAQELIAKAQEKIKEQPVIKEQPKAETSCEDLPKIEGFKDELLAYYYKAFKLHKNEGKFYQYKQKELRDYLDLIISSRKIDFGMIVYDKDIYIGNQLLLKDLHKQVEVLLDYFKEKDYSGKLARYKDILRRYLNYQGRYNPSTLNF